MSEPPASYPPPPTPRPALADTPQAFTIALNRAAAGLRAIGDQRWLVAADVQHELAAWGLAIVPEHDQDHPLYGDPAGHDPQAFAADLLDWLDRKRYLARSHNDDLVDTLNLYLQDRREARAAFRRLTSDD